MIIRVEQRHIDAGSRSNCSGCPIALALTEAIKKAVRVFRYNFAIEKRPIPVMLPAVATTFIKNFDAGRSVKPFEFEFEEGSLS